MASDDDAALVAELRRRRERLAPNGEVLILSVHEHDHLLALADEALSLRRVRDAAAEFVEMRRRIGAQFGRLEAILCASLDADAARGEA